MNYYATYPKVAQSLSSLTFIILTNNIMSDVIERKIIDTAIDHPQHKYFSRKCSQCYKEICKDCNGNGELSTMERVYANDEIYAPVGIQTCENCGGSGLEQDQDIINERNY